MKITTRVMSKIRSNDTMLADSVQHLSLSLSLEMSLRASLHHKYIFSTYSAFCGCQYKINYLSSKDSNLFASKPSLVCRQSSDVLSGNDMSWQRSDLDVRLLVHYASATIQGRLLENAWYILKKRCDRSPSAGTERIEASRVRCRTPTAPPWHCMGPGSGFFSSI